MVGEGFSPGNENCSGVSMVRNHQARRAASVLSAEEAGSLAALPPGKFPLGPGRGRKPGPPAAPSGFSKQNAPLEIASAVRQLRLGEKIKALRGAQRLTLRRVAEGTGLSIPLLSQIENGAVAPPVATLLKIARVLGVGIGHFFRAEESAERAVVVRRSERRRVSPRLGGLGGEVGYSFEALADKKNDKHMEPFFVEFAPRRKEEVVFLNHCGEEFLFLLRGSLAFHYDREEIRLERGDCLYFDSAVPHGFRGLRRKAQGIVVVYPEE